MRRPWALALVPSLLLLGAASATASSLPNSFSDLSVSCDPPATYTGTPPTPISCADFEGSSVRGGAAQSSTVLVQLPGSLFLSATSAAATTIDNLSGASAFSARAILRFFFSVVATGSGSAAQVPFSLLVTGSVPQPPVNANLRLRPSVESLNDSSKSYSEDVFNGPIDTRVSLNAVPGEIFQVELDSLCSSGLLPPNQDVECGGGLGAALFAIDPAFASDYAFEFSPDLVIPEPGTALLTGGGLLALVGVARRRDARRGS